MMPQIRNQSVFCLGDFEKHLGGGWYAVVANQVIFSTWTHSSGYKAPEISWHVTSPLGSHLGT